MVHALSIYSEDNSRVLPEIKAILIDYNMVNGKITNNIISIEEEITNIFNQVINLTLSIDITNKAKEKTNTNTDKIVLGDNNLLLISEKTQKAYLPYKFNEIENILKKNDKIYDSHEDIIEKLYVVPLDKFKNSIISRFREGFKLIREKEHGSISKAFDLAFELMFKHNLNPIIVSACRSLNELDIYLDCLEENELNDFGCFEIKFEINPSLT